MKKIDFTPRPTEYRGITFRSKSEAKYARLLDIVFPNNKWAYEPKDVHSALGSGYTPDFMCFTPAENLRRFVAFVIEYKPSPPTRTYVREFFGVRWKQIQDSLGPIHCEPMLHCVDFWNRKAILMHSPYHMWEGKDKIPLLEHLKLHNIAGSEYVDGWEMLDQSEALSDEINEVNKYRFDLKQ